MYGLLSKLAEILSSYGFRFLDSRRASRDTDVAAQLVRIVLALQDLCVRGERILKLTDGFVDGMAHPGASAEFESLVDRQVQALGELRSMLEQSRALLATIDVEFYLELAPFLDKKSGLVTRWSQQVSQSRFSTTTLFFLPADSLQRLIEIGRAQASPVRLDTERTDYLMAMADGIRDVRSREIRDIRSAAARDNEVRVRSEIVAARTDLARTRGLCSGLLASTEEAVGPEAMTGLRRKLLPQSRGK